ncbi:hypothetical protein [Dickeya fangzhongdai]|uniref:hypothetical protein n=1 Tax=Dickeya fangzhongdai TaxID=1778540 RepID=UPI0026E0A153|nr:hypothetical protein [Dickeya fangzhongdai]WKV50729.1 hypothetical protein PL145_23535 [Dickeya fangzhongdai]
MALVCLCAHFREPDSDTLKIWSHPAGRGIAVDLRPACAAVQPVSARWNSCLRGDPLHFTDWTACIDAAGRVELSMTGYGVFLLTTVALCVFQEQVVIRMKRALTERFLDRRFQPSRSAAQ